MDIHIDTQVGFSSDGINIEEKTDIHGERCFRAWTTPTHLFGIGVDAAPIEGYAKTKELAIDRMLAAQKKFYESMWF